MNALQLVYNTLMLAALCLLCPMWMPLVRWREKYRETFFNRLWMASLSPAQPACGPAPVPSTIWIHALSVGEVLSAEPLVKALARKHGAANLVFTASTHTGVQMARRVMTPHVQAVRHFPYDTLFSVNRALRVVRPRMVVIVETDLWPNFLYRLDRCAIPVYLVNARLSTRSYRGYKRIDFLMVPLLSRFRRICVQSARDRQRFLDLGLPGDNVVLAGNLKFDQAPVGICAHEREQLSTGLGLGADKPVWVAGSTHPHEEEILGKAFLRLRAAGLDVTLVVAPRDPGRALDVCEILRRQGIQAMTMAQIETQGRSSAAAVVVDRLGILRKLYALADVTFVGGSLVNAGGHNPLEPASVAKPVLFGPYTEDFDWISRALENAGGAYRVANENQLSAMLRELLLNKDKKNDMGQRAHTIFNSHQGAVQRTLAALQTLASDAARQPRTPRRIDRIETVSRKKKALEGLRNYLESISKTDGPAALLGIETVLHVISILYGAVMAIRARLYKIGLLPSRVLPCRVVAIGNITAGGTGKTPMTICVAQAIQRLGYRVVVISRGYKGRMERTGGIVSDGRTVFHGPDGTGDEPYLMATSLADIPVVVGSDRYQAGMLAMRRFAPDVVVLDDAFQHLRLKRDLDLVLLDQRAPLGNGRLIPRGRLREPLSALRRAHALVFTRCDAAAPAQPLPPEMGRRPIFHTIHVPVISATYGTADPLVPDDRIDFSVLQARKALAFSGLADNDQFFRSLQQGGCRLVHQIAFGDHHRYCASDLRRIVNQAVASGAELLITTAKDWVKIQPIYDWSMAVVAVDVRIGWLGDPERFDRFLSTAMTGTASRA